MRLIARYVSVLLVLGLISNCEIRPVAERLIPPTITDTTAAWRAGDRRTLTARVSTSTAWEIIDVYARYTRHFWPGARDAHETVAQNLGRPNSANYFAVPDDAVGALAADHLFYEWFVDYRLKAGGTLKTARSGRQDFVVNCSVDDTNITLRVLQDLARGTLSTANPQNDLPFKEYQAISHLFASLAGNGVTFTHSSVATKPFRISVTHLRSIWPSAVLDLLTGAEANMIGLPKLVFYAPRQLLPGEPPTVITEPTTPDPPYSLIGGGHVRSHNSSTRRPSLGCIPSSEWFVHEAGYHLRDGRMRLRPPPEARRGARATTEMVPPVNGYAGPPPANTLLWHPRFWDLHIW